MCMKQKFLLEKIKGILETFDEKKLKIIYVFILGLKDKG